MIFFPGLTARRSLLLFLVVLVIARISAAQDAATTDDATAATDATTAETTAQTTAQTTDSTATTTDATTTDATTTDATTTDATTTDATTSTSSSTSSSSSSTSEYPVVTVPPTADAPYMQTSNTPEGTVFIAVGAALGFIGLAVLAWRGLVAWSVNRSVRQAALVHSSETKGLLRSKKKRSTVYSGAPVSTLSLEKLGTSRSSYKPSAKATKVSSSNSGLFFSPTAGAGMHGHGHGHSSGNRGSTYLPAGYYAAPSGQNSQGYTRTRTGPSPPSSPTQPPSNVYDPHHSNHYRQDSASSLNLNSPPQGRAPSAYLEDLFDSHAPGSDYRR